MNMGKETGMILPEILRVLDSRYLRYVSASRRVCASDSTAFNCCQAKQRTLPRSRFW